MKTYIVLLRAVNVSGKNIIKMAELVKVLNHAGYKNVKTYIQSGNIILTSNLAVPKLKDDIRKLIFDHFNLSISVFVLEKDQLDKILADNPFDDKSEKNRVFITLFDAIPQQDLIEKFDLLNFGEEEYVIKDHVFYFYVPNGMANSKLSNPFIENKLKVIGTGRNLNTMSKLRELAFHT